MARHTSTIAAALTVSAALLLTACGGGSDDASKDKIKGADKGPTGPSASASSPAAPGVQRPAIKLPKGFQADFEGWTNSDPELQSVLNDGKERLRATYAAIGDSNPKADYLAFYSTQAALATGSEWVKGYKGLTITGKVTAYNPEVHLKGKKTATLFYCVDEGKGYSKNLKTGKLSGTPKGESPKVRYSTGLGKTAEGIWQTTTVESEAGGC
ncbi:hypothetical protein OG285_13585 [Streptomyces sp. NBC_01471]|uniref:hypothetical protein n=1 Tax=Streptomyces sp. NBC_01471 TaxID=2903879 RepID=UPI003252909C